MTDAMYNICNSREPSFGHAILAMVSATVAKWEWHRNQVRHAPAVLDGHPPNTASAVESCRRASLMPGVVALLVCAEVGLHWRHTGATNLLLNHQMFSSARMQDDIPTVTDTYTMVVNVTACP